MSVDNCTCLNFCPTLKVKAPRTPAKEAQKAVLIPARRFGTLRAISFGSKLKSAIVIPVKHPKIPRVVKTSGP